MNHARALTQRVLLFTGALLAPAAADEMVVTWPDAVGDAVIRRTDPGNDGPIHPSGVVPDIVELKLGAWQAFDAAADPYTGSYIDPDEAHLFRLDLVVNGLINPPGPLGLAGFPFDPFRFGVSPLYGFIDLDLDDQKNTGGELEGAATFRYLANVARFGRLPYGSIGERAAQSALDLDDNFFSDPQFERTGADFALVFCGCWDVTIVSQSGDGDSVFDAGETWVVRGRFLERAQGFKDASCAFGGSDFGLYDPLTNIRFAHDVASDRTTITFVGALDMTGAAMLTGQPQQPIDLNVANHTSIVEGLLDIIIGAETKSFDAQTEELVDGWKGRDPFDFLDPTDWHVTALVGMPYSVADPAALYVWTDTGFDETHADLDSDGIAGPLDRLALQLAVYELDGTSFDADGSVNGKVQIVDFGPNFSLFDLDGNGVIEFADVYAYGNPADFNEDGVLNIFDFLAFQGAIVAGDLKADFNFDGVLNIFDFLAFQAAFLN